MSNLTLHKWFIATLLLLALFYAESALFPWVVPVSWRSQLLVFPKAVFIGVIYVAMFTNRHIGVAFGLAFGLLQDVIFYGHMIGINAFTYSLAAYAAGWLTRPKLISLFSVFLIQLSALLLYELSIYGLYRLFGVTSATFAWTFINGMLPSILISLFLALALYIPARKQLEMPKKQQDAEEE